MSRFRAGFVGVLVVLGTALFVIFNTAGASTPNTPGTQVATRSVGHVGLRVGTLLSAPAKGLKGQKVKHYQWERRLAKGKKWVNIKGATHRTYRVTKSDIGYVIRTALVIAGTQGSTTVTTGPTPVIVGPLPVNTSLPTISGTAQVGDTLTGTQGTWNYAISYTYLWLLCNPNTTAQTTTDVVGGTVAAGACVPIVVSGTSTQETATTYTIQSGDAGFTIEFQVTAYNYPNG